MFRQYKSVSSAILSRRVASIITVVKEQYLIDADSSDPTGVQNEDILPYVLICKEYENWKLRNSSLNTQQAASRIVHAVT